MKAESVEVTVVAKPQSNKRTCKETRRRQWSNLTHDLLSLIISKLYFTDRTRFRAVCKDWHIPIGDRPVNELPWVVTHTFSNVPAEEIRVDEIRVMLSDPVQKKMHTIPNFAGVRDEYFDCFAGSRICASKCGWLFLLASCKRSYIGIHIFLYGPFTNNVIMLPTLFAITPYRCKATFSSSNPTSPYCIFAITHCDEQRGLGISTSRNGDNKWRTKILDRDFKRQVVSLVCTEKGVCYYVLECGKLGAFCVESQECSWLVNSVWILRDWTHRDDMHLVEFNGDLLIAKCFITCDHCEVFKYDGNKRGWVEQKSLGDRVLFIGCSSYLRSAIGDTADLANKIVYHYHTLNISEIRAYSLKDGMSYKRSRAYDWMVNDPVQMIWFEPPY